MGATYEARSFVKISTAGLSTSDLCMIVYISAIEFFKDTQAYPGMPLPAGASKMPVLTTVLVP